LLQRTVADASADVQHGCGRRGQMLEQLLMKNVGADPAFDRRVHAVDGLVGQRGPPVIRHMHDHGTGCAPLAAYPATGMPTVAAL
jgi:hypothetical protein